MRMELDPDRPATLLWHGDLLRGWLALLEGRPADCLALLESPGCAWPRRRARSVPGGASTS
ncbi:MAG: hypothetical protein U5R48_08010 [Gammaproteobacteria bacterium]|nr:hypothetical protein [Gammaproteobacteria bacterium]